MRTAFFRSPCRFEFHAALRLPVREAGRNAARHHVFIITVRFLESLILGTQQAELQKGLELAVRRAVRGRQWLCRSANRPDAQERSRCA
jgi:hypothetical protein